MTRRITKNDMLVYVPAVPATPFIPGYETVIKTWPAFGLSEAESLDVYNTIGDWDSGAVLGRYDSSGTVIEAYTVTPAVDATPGVPAYTIDTGVAAWNAGGSTVSPLDGNGAFEFYIGNSPGGIVAGLSATDLSTLPSEPTHGFYIHGSVVQVIESGAIKHTFFAPVNATTRFVVRRTATTVYYEVDHTAGGVYASEYYTSDVPIAAGKIRLDAALYLSGDYVDAPSMIEGTSGMTVGTVFGTLRPVGGRIGDVLMVVYGELRPVSGLVYQSPLGAAGFITGSIPPLAGYAAVLTGSQASVSGTLKPVKGKASNYAYSFVDGSLFAVRGEATDIDPAFFRTAMSGLSLATPTDGTARMFDVATSSVMFSDAYAAAVRMSDSVFDALMLSGAISSTQSIADTIMAALALGTDLSQFIEVDLSPAEVAARAPTQYAVNVLTGALTTYDGFDFTGFATTGQTTFGARADGVYRIRPGDDAGESRIVAVDFGTLAMDTTTVKTIEAVFLGVDTDGDVFVRLVAGLDDTLYRVVERESVSRALCKRGVGGRQWNVSLEVANATYLNLDMIELSVASMARRWSSR
jgi:hypothetical protein